VEISKNTRNKLIVVTGPTASGKTELAIKIALFIKKNFKNLKGAEIISADSRQIYKNLEIGSNYPSPSQLKKVKHHLIGRRSVKNKISVSQFQKLALKIIKKLWKENKIPIICGGTWFYIKALIDGIKFPEVPPQKKLRKKLEKKDLKDLWFILKKLDKRTYERIDKNNKKRIIRAIEIATYLGKVPPLHTSPLPAQILIIAKDIQKEKLKEKIEKRTKLMIKKGLIKETQNLLKMGVSKNMIKELGFEYKNVLDYLEGRIKTKKELAEKISKDTILYVKKQLTWLKKEKRIEWIKTKKEALTKTQKFLS
jgi:tRNA dimethylallyltransferase